MRKEENVRSTRAVGRRKYLILISICMVAFIGVFCQFQMQPMANEIKSSLGISDSQFSALFTAPMTPAIFISLICGIIVDKKGARWPMFISLIIGTLGLWGRVFATSYLPLYLSVFVVGFAATFGNSSNAKMFSGWFTPEESTICIGIYMASSSIGIAIATASTPFLPSLKVAYIVSAVIISLVTVCWFLFYRDWKGGTGGGSQEGAAAEETESLGVTIKTVLRQKDIIKACIGDTFLYGGHQALSTFLAVVLIAKGMDQKQAGVISAIVSVGMIVGNLLIPQIVTRVGRLRLPLVLFTGIGAVMMLLAAFVPGGIALDVILFLEGMLVGGSIPVIMSVPLRLKEIGTTRIGTASGLIATFQLLGAVVMPTYVISVLAHGNYTLLVVLCAISTLIGILCLASMSKKVEHNG